jgi:hypothetical protein
MTSKHSAKWAYAAVVFMWAASSGFANAQSNIMQCGQVIGHEPNYPPQIMIKPCDSPQPIADSIIMQCGHVIGHGPYPSQIMIEPCDSPQPIADSIIMQCGHGIGHGPYPPQIMISTGGDGSCTAAVRIRASHGSRRKTSSSQRRLELRAHDLGSMVANNNNSALWPIRK